MADPTPSCEEPTFDAEAWASQEPETKDHEKALLKKEVKRLRRTVDKAAANGTIIMDTVREMLSDADLAPIPPPLHPASRKKNEEIAVLHISDTQIGKKTDTYSTEIAGDRFELLARKVLNVVEIRRAAARINEIRIYLGGDIVEHETKFPTQWTGIDQPVGYQAIRYAPEMISRLVLTMAAHFKNVVVRAVPGNHGNVFGDGSHEVSNWDYVACETARLRTLGPEDARRKGSQRIDWTECDKWFQVDRVFGWGNLLVHGHQIRGGFAGFPWYGAGKKAWGWIDSIPEPWDYLWFGHFHTFASFVLNYRHVLANGTMESGNEYAQQQLAAAGHPCQRLSFFNRDYGLIADNQIFLDESRIPASQKHLGWIPDEE